MGTAMEAMYATRRYRVVAIKIVVPDPSVKGGDNYLRRGQLISGTTPTQWVDRALELGLIEEEVTS